MPPRSSKRAVPEEAPEPPFYVATDNLPAGGPDQFPTLAFLAGDRVTPADLDAHPQWGDRVEVPEQFAGQLAPPPPPPVEPAAEDQPPPDK